MKTWMKTVVPLFVFSLAPLAHAEATGDQAKAEMAANVGVGGNALASSLDARQVSALRESVERLSKQIVELEAQKNAQSASLGNPDSHPLWP